MKTLLKLIVLLVVLLVAAIVAGIFYMDSIAKGAIEIAGTNVLGVKTTVGGVSIGLVSGTAGLDKLEVANPEGFKSPEFFTLQKGGVAVTPASLLSDVIRVPKIELNDLALSFEQKVGGGSNVDAILANLKKFSGGSGDGKPSSSGGSSEGGKKFVIDELTITNIQVTARTLDMPLGDKGITITVPKVQLRDIGSGGKDPVGLNQLTGMIVQVVMKAVMDAGAGQLPDIFMQGLGNGLAGLGDTFTKGLGGLSIDAGKGLQDITDQLGKGVTEGVGKALEGAGKGVEDAAKGAGDAVKKGLDGLFKK